MKTQYIDEKHILTIQKILKPVKIYKNLYFIDNLDFNIYLRERLERL